MERRVGGFKARAASTIPPEITLPLRAVSGFAVAINR